MKIHGFRYQLLGDSIGSLPLLNYFENKFPGSYKYFAIAKKCSHLAPLLLNHKLIDKIHILDGQEGPESAEDFEIINSCDIVINGNPDHPFEHDWPNYRSFYEEVWVMAGLSLNEYHNLPKNQRLPKLYKWFKPEPRPTVNKKIIACWPFAGYAKEPKRSASKQYYQILFNRLIQEGFDICQFGHFNDPQIFHRNTNGYYYFNDLDFFQQIRMTLSTDCVISTDSGSGLIFAAYSHPQINLINRHWPGHITNNLSLAPQGDNTINLFGELGCDSILVENIIKEVKNFVKD